MNQTKKRLAIIKLSISITDEDCIQHQLLKLTQIRSDEKLQEILGALQEKNYAQAQGLITKYIETPTHEILQRTEISNEKEKIINKEEQKEQMIIADFELLPQEEESVVPMQEIEEIESFVAPDVDIAAATSPKNHNVNYDALLNLEAEDILPDNIDIDLSEPQKDDFFDEKNMQPQKQEKEDHFFDTKVLEKDRAPSFDDALTKLIQREEAKRTEDKEADLQTKETPLSYKAIPHLEEKLDNLMKQYTPIELEETPSEAVSSLLEKIKTEGCTEKEIEETIDYLIKLSAKGKKAEAAKLLLIVAATPSLYARFMLARTLFKGELFQKNIPEAFGIIYTLANDENYPEAICDLAQLYEYGIGTEKDPSKAESLYSDAAQMGIERAKKHVERIQKENKGFFSLLKK